MANLDKLLKKIEKNKETENETTIHQLTVGDVTYDVRTMTRKEKRDFIYTIEAAKKGMSMGDIIEKAKPYIYKTLELSELAVKAKDAGYIKTYYDVVEALFEPEEILEIVAFIMDINGISADEAQKEFTEEIEEAKKQ